MWRIYTMSELWYLLNTEASEVFIKPSFPTRRWNRVTTKTSTTDILAINKGIDMLRKSGYTVRKRICYDDNKKFKTRGNFYRIEIKDVAM